MSFEEVAKKVADARVMAMNFACGEKDKAKQEKLWKLSAFLKIVLRRVQEIHSESA